MTVERVLVIVILVVLLIVILDHSAFWHCP